MQNAGNVAKNKQAFNIVPGEHQLNGNITSIL